MPDDDPFDGHTFSIKGEVELDNIDFDTLHKLMTHERIQDPDAAIYALMALLHDYKKPLHMTGDAMRAVRDNKKLTIAHNPESTVVTVHEPALLLLGMLLWSVLCSGLLLILALRRS